jgi:hypothetical protein
MYHYDVAKIVADYGWQAMEDPLPGGAEGICLFGFFLWLLMMTAKTITIGLREFFMKE